MAELVLRRVTLTIEHVLLVRLPADADDTDVQQRLGARLPFLRLRFRAPAKSFDHCPRRVVASVHRDGADVQARHGWDLDLTTMRERRAQEPDSQVVEVIPPPAAADRPDRAKEGGGQ